MGDVFVYFEVDRQVRLLLAADEDRSKVRGCSSCELSRRSGSLPPPDGWFVVVLLRLFGTAVGLLLLGVSSRMDTSQQQMETVPDTWKIGKSEVP